jgi:hypothetical protein
MAQQYANMTYQGLLDAGVPEPQARLGATNPDVQKAIVAKMFPEFKPQNIGNTTGSFNPATGQFRPQYIAPEFKTVGAGDTGISYQPPLASAQPGISSPLPSPPRPAPLTPGSAGAGPGPTGLPQGARSSPIQTSPLAPPSGARGPMPLGGTQTLVPGQSVEDIAAAKARGEVVGQQQAALGQARTNFDAMLKNIADLQKHPGKDAATGMFMGRLPYGRTQDAQNFINQEAQLKGQVAGIIAQARTSNSRALGALADQIQAGIAGLDRTSSTDDYSKGLDNLRDLITAYKQNAIDLAASKPIDTSAGTAAAQPSTAKATPKYREGQIARSKNGPPLIFRGGVWQPM